MRSICPNLRSALVALLTIALLIGPCLSFNGYFGPSAAHAHGSVSQIASQGDASGHGHAHHNAGQPTQDQQGSGHHQSPNQSPISCEELCEGWAVTKDLRSLALTGSLDSDPVDTPTISVLVGIQTDITRLTLAAGKPPGNRDTDAFPAPLPAYALTSRYRL